MGPGGGRDWQRLLARLTLASLVVTTVACSGRADPGPLAPLRPRPGAGVGFELRVGDDSTWSDLDVFNHGTRPAVLDGVELVEARGGVEVIGVLAAERPAPPGCNLAGGVPFPPSFGWEMRPLEGFVVPPASASGGHVVCVILGLRTTRPGIATARGVAIHYHVGDRSYTYVIPYSLVICTPNVPSRDCVPPDPVRSLA